MTHLIPLGQSLQALWMLSEHPQEYIFIPRGPFALDVPKSFYPDRFRENADLITDRFSSPEILAINVLDIEEPDIEFAANNGRNESFSLFNPNDREVSSQLITMLMNQKDPKSFISTAAYIRDRVNPFLFQYALSVAIQHRPELRGIEIPSVLSQFPNNFIDPTILKNAKEETEILPQIGDKKNVVEVPLPGSRWELEQRLAYFREDIGVNMHHWHWHLVFPNNGPIEVVSKDRRGELFMYMHNQILARYNLERFCNGLGKTVPLGNLREPIPEGYYPSLLDSVSNRTYPPRLPGQTLHDMNRPDLVTTIADLERWTDRIIGSIDRGFVFDPSGNRIPLDEKNGMDLLGNLVESSMLSVNPQFYGDLHNRGHLIISYIHDPNGNYQQEYSVMGDTTTAMRDPIFYRWHTFIDNLGARHKAVLPPYEHREIGFDQVTVNDVVAVCKSMNSQPNVMRTYWRKSDVDIGVGLDGRRNDLSATFRFTHLSHEPFDYRISVINSGNPTEATCRIFLLPIEDQRQVGLVLEDQRLLAVEMDRFPVFLKPGQNTIRRASSQSSVTIPFNQIFKPRTGPVNLTDPMEECLKSYCSCGWPGHLLLPKGSPEGKLFKLFVMISNDSNSASNAPSSFLDYNARYKEHLTDPSKDLMNDQLKAPLKEGTASSYCGLRDEKYPDSRSMGFPFDRRLPALYLNGLLKDYKNMKTCDLTIAFSENERH